MSTIAFDSKSLVCDSLLTGPYLEQTDFIKIDTAIDRFAFGCTGRCGYERIFKEFLELEFGYLIDGDMRWSQKNFTIPESIQFGAVVYDRKHNRFHQVDSDLFSIPSSSIGAAGSGEKFAMGALMVGATAEQAVSAAIKLDPYSGGPLHKISLEDFTLTTIE